MAYKLSEKELKEVTDAIKGNVKKTESTPKQPSKAYLALQDYLKNGPEKTAAIQTRGADTVQKLDVQKKKEDRLDAKSQVDSVQIKKDRAEKALKDFDENREVDWTQASDRKKHEAERKRLQDAVDQAGAELAEREAAAHRQRDTADIAALTEEDRDALEQYAVNQIRDQNLPIELTGMMPTAEQEAAEFTDKVGRQRARELAETFMREENAKLAEDTEAAGRKFAEERPVIASAATVPVNLMSGIVGTVGQLQGAARATGRYGSLDANETGTALDKFSGAVRDQVAQDISGDVYDENGNQVEEGGALRQIGSFAYQGGMSFLDSTARMLATGGSSGISSAIAGLGAFSQGLQKYSAMGASPEQAALAATASAGLEYITEKLPTDQVLKIFHKGGGTGAVKEVLKQAFLTEPLGEEVNLFAGIAAEALILGEKSGKDQRIGDLIACGQTRAEAEKQFWKETFGEAAQTYAVSAFSGLFGGGSAAIAGNQVQAGQDQQQIATPKQSNDSEQQMQDNARRMQEYEADRKTRPETIAKAIENRWNREMSMDRGSAEFSESDAQAVLADPEAVAWMQARGLDPADIASLEDVDHERYQPPGEVPAPAAVQQKQEADVSPQPVRIARDPKIPRGAVDAVNNAKGKTYNYKNIEDALTNGYQFKENSVKFFVGRNDEHGIFSGRIENENGESIYNTGILHDRAETVRKLVEYAREIQLLGAQKMQTTQKAPEISIAPKAAQATAAQSSAPVMTSSTGIQTAKAQAPLHATQAASVPMRNQQNGPKPKKDIYFHFQSVAPTASYFDDDNIIADTQQEHFTLMDDNSVDLDLTRYSTGINQARAIINRFSVLYDFTLDGEPIDPEDPTYSGIFVTFEDVERPIPRKINGGNLIPDKKGVINLYSDCREIPHLKVNVQARNPEAAASQQQEAQPPVPTEAELAQLAMEDTVAGLQETAPAAAPTAPMTEPQQSLQMAMEDLMGGQEQPEAEQVPASDAESDYYDEFEDFGTSGSNREEFLGRDWDEVGKRNVKAYMYENPEVKPYFQMEAQLMLMELADSTRGERSYNEDVHYESGGEKGWNGVKRDTSEDIAYLLDTAGFSYAEIEKGLNAIIGDNGAENNAASKRIEFILHNRLMNGHKDFYGDRETYPDGRVPASEEYVRMINDKQITAYDNEPTATVDTPEAVGDNLTASASSPQTEDSGTMPAEGGQIAGPGAVEANFTGKVAYANLLQEGNVQPDRSGDVRPMEVPKTDGNGKRVTEFAANAYGAGATTDEMAYTIESLIQDGELGFNVRTNRESLDNAAAVISKRGAAEARNQITRNISKGKIRDGDIEQGILLYARYAEKGDNDNASEMLVDLAQMANITGRNLQMFKLLRRMTVEGQVMTLEKEVRRSVESMIRSGQVKKGYEPGFDPQMMDGYRKALEELRLAKTPETQEVAKLKAKQTQEALYADAAAKMPATFKAKWDAWRYMAMLGNAKTQIRNLAGNAAFMPYKEVKDKMGALAEKVLIPKDQRTKSLTTDRGLLQWARDDRKNNESVRDALKYSAAIGDDVTSQKIRDDIKVFNTKALESLRGFVNKVPQAGDMLFKNGYYERSLAGFLRGRGYTAADIQSGKVTEAVLNEARSYAVQEAMKATFNDCNAFSDFLATELRYKGDNPVGKVLNIAAEGVLPFRRTPANIAVRFTEYSPVGVAKGLWNAATKVRSGEMTAATAIDQLTAGLTGSAVMALGYALAEGLGGVKITGSGTDEDEKRQGHQDYALEFSKDGQEYSYKIDWAAPANLPLFVGANIYSALNSEGNSQDVAAFTSFLRGMGTMFEPLLALSCMSSLNDLVEGVRYADEGEALYSMAASMATSYFTQGIPALARQNYQANQEYKQTTFTTSDDPSIRDLQKTAAGLGVSDAYKTDKVDAWGQKEYQGKKVDRNFNAFFNPGTLKKIDNSAVEQEITRLNNAGHNVSPNTAARTISYIDKDGYGHDEVRLTEEQFQTLAQTQGQTARKLVEDMISSKNYAGMTDAQKAEAIDTAYLYARKTGEIAAIDDHTGYDQTWMMDVNKRGANEILRRVLNSDLNGSMSDLDTAWDRGYEEENFSRALQSAFDSFSKATPAMQKQVYAEAEGTTRKYLEARSKGISHIDFLEVAESIAKVKGTGAINKDTGKATVRDIDRRKAIANTKGMTDKEIDIVMKAYMADYDPSDSSPETTEFKYRYAREELGLSPKEYTSTYQAYLDNSKKNQKIAAIRALGYDYRTANALYRLYYGSMKNELIDLYG